MILNILKIEIHQKKNSGPVPHKRTDEFCLNMIRTFHKFYIAVAAWLCKEIEHEELEPVIHANMLTLARQEISDHS